MFLSIIFYDSYVCKLIHEWPSIVVLRGIVLLWRGITRETKLCLYVNDFLTLRYTTIFVLVYFLYPWVLGVNALSFSCIIHLCTFLIVISKLFGWTPKVSISVSLNLLHTFPQQRAGHHLVLEMSLYFSFLILILFAMCAEPCHAIDDGTLTRSSDQINLVLKVKVKNDS